MARKQRDYRAEYRRRLERGSVFAKRDAAAKRLGYKSYGEQRRRRKTDDLTHLDRARHAVAPGDRKRITDIGGGRRTWASQHRDGGLTPGDKLSLHRFLKAARDGELEQRATITAAWRHPNGRTGSAAAGGGYGVDVARLVGADPPDTYDLIEDELQNAAGSELPAGAAIVQLSLYVFPIGEGAE